MEWINASKVTVIRVVESACRTAVVRIGSQALYRPIQVVGSIKHHAQLKVYCSHRVRCSGR